MREEYLPLFAKAADRPRAAQVLKEKIRPSFLEQRLAVERTVKATREVTAREEEATNQRISFWLTTMIVISAFSVLIIFFAGGLVARNILRSTSAVIDRVKEMAGGASDLTARLKVESQDELGELATGINAMIFKIQTVVPAGS